MLNLDFDDIRSVSTILWYASARINLLNSTMTQEIDPEIIVSFVYVTGSIVLCFSAECSSFSDHLLRAYIIVKQAIINYKETPQDLKRARIF
jgi:hypothetical protein